MSGLSADEGPQSPELLCSHSSHELAHLALGQTVSCTVMVLSEGCFAAQAFLMSSWGGFNT